MRQFLPQKQAKLASKGGEHHDDTMPSEILTYASKLNFITWPVATFFIFLYVIKPVAEKYIEIKKRATGEIINASQENRIITIEKFMKIAEENHFTELDDTIRRVEKIDESFNGPQGVWARLAKIEQKLWGNGNHA